MIKYEIIIEEKTKKCNGEKSVTGVQVQTRIEGKNFSRSEKEVCDIIEKRLNLKENEVIDKTKNKSFEELLDKLLSL